MMTPLRKSVSGNAPQAKIDPNEWLMRHRDVSSSGSLDMGVDALNRHNGNMAEAMASEPEIRTEIAIAYLFTSPGITDSLKMKIVSIAEVMDSIDED